jgi:phosphoglucosamine mutase
MTQFFGTDGIRGVANQHPMTAEIALKLGIAAGGYFARGSHRNKVVIAKDTRLSGYMLETALTSGFVSAGMDVILVGPMPTPAVAMLVKSLRAEMGVMISASHNPYMDNGIKLFGPDGYKLSDRVEIEIEQRLLNSHQASLARPESLGRAKRLEDAPGRYIEFAKATFPKHLTLEGLTLVLDCANGAAYHLGPAILRELGANVHTIGVEPNGFNINQGVGSTSPELLRERVIATGANAGIALDGDADRVIICDERGTLLDGDKLLAMVAANLHERGLLKGGGVVATVMSNMGLERYLHTLGLHLHRTKVGDRYVMEAMMTGGYNLGGEQSGHIILNDYVTTGDGLIAALQVLAVMAEKQVPLSDCGHCFEPLPQVLKNVRITAGANPLARDAVKNAMETVEQRLQGVGRLLVRPSGTEPLIRVMIEGEDPSAINTMADELCSLIAAAA